MPSGIVDDRIETFLKPDQRQRIAGRSPLFYQPAYKLPRRLDFALEFTTLCVKPGANGSDVIRWRLDFIDNDSPQLQRTFQRADVGSRKIAIGRNVASAKVVQLVTNLYYRRHRQNGRDGHHHNQYDGNTHDIPPNGQANHVSTSSTATYGASNSNRALAPDKIESRQRERRDVSLVQPVQPA